MSKRYGFTMGPDLVRVIKHGEEPIDVYRGLVAVGYDPQPVTIEPFTDECDTPGRTVD